MESSKPIVSVAEGNKFYLEGKYAEALAIYRQIATAQPGLAKAMGSNITRCIRAIEKSGIAPGITSKAIRLGSNDNGRGIIHKPIDILRAQSLPEPAVILSLIESLSVSSITLTHLSNAIICARSSPYQRDLLWYIASMANKLGVPIQYVSDDIGEVSLNTLILIASNRIQWLLTRSRVRQWLEANQIIDPRAWDLVVEPPDDSSEEYSKLPKFRKVTSHRYEWKDRPAKKVLPSSREYSVALGTILLNERKFIGLNLLQHYDLCDAWTLVEGTYQGYPAGKVSESGLSLDDCSSQIRIFPDPSLKINFIQHGWTKYSGENAKSEIRNRYLESCNSDYLLVVDADEFYLKKDFETALEKIHRGGSHACTLPQVHFWKNIRQFIVGEFYDITHIRLYRHIPGMRYIRNHNFPEIGGKYLQELGHEKLHSQMVKVGNDKYSYSTPCCFHMGFAKDFDVMEDKDNYSMEHGEQITKKSITESNTAWLTSDLPEKCKLYSWGGNIPAVLTGLQGGMQ